MAVAYICDAVRTPIGRYAGALAAVRADDLGAIPLRALCARNAASTGRGRRRDLRLRQPGRRGQPQRRAHGPLLAGLPVRCPAHDGEPAVRLGHGGGGDRRARDQGGRSGTADRRRRGEDDARAVRDGQGHGGVQPQRGDLRHHDRLALRQPGDEGAVRRRLDAGDRGERRRGDKVRASRRTRSRSSQKKRVSGAGKGGSRRRSSRSKTRAVRGAAARRAGRAPRADTTLEKLAKLGTPFRRRRQVTAGNASGVNDGACALIASEAAAKRHGLTPRARVVMAATAGVRRASWAWGRRRRRRRC